MRADISAECSNDKIRAVIVFNGTFKGIIYSSGYVNDPTCLYINGTGASRYEFDIRLNQCGTLGRQELHQPSVPGEARVSIPQISALHCKKRHLPMSCMARSCKLNVS